MRSRFFGRCEGDADFGDFLALPLVPKLQLGHALVPEALLRLRGWDWRPPSSAARPTKHSFADTGMTKPELGHEERAAKESPQSQSLSAVFAGARSALECGDSFAAFRESVMLSPAALLCQRAGIGDLPPQPSGVEAKLRRRGA